MRVYNNKYIIMNNYKFNDCNNVTTYEIYKTEYYIYYIYEHRLNKLSHFHKYSPYVVTKL